MQKSSPPYIWIVSVRHVPGMNRVDPVAFDNKDEAREMATQVHDLTGRETFVSRALFQSEVDRRLAAYRTLVAMGLTE